MDECKPLPHVELARAAGAVRGGGGAHLQGLTLVHFSAQLKRILWRRVHLGVV